MDDVSVIFNLTELSHLNLPSGMAAPAYNVTDIFFRAFRLFIFWKLLISVSILLIGLLSYPYWLVNSRNSFLLVLNTVNVFFPGSFIYILILFVIHFWEVLICFIKLIKIFALGLFFLIVRAFQNYKTWYHELLWFYKCWVTFVLFLFL